MKEILRNSRIVVSLIFFIFWLQLGQNEPLTEKKEETIQTASVCKYLQRHHLKIVTKVGMASNLQVHTQMLLLVKIAPY